MRIFHLCPAAEKKSTGLVGFFVFIGLTILGILIIQFGRFGDRFSDRYPLYVEFTDAAGLVKDSDVHMRGAKIGSVVTQPTHNRQSGLIEVELRIDPDIKIPIGSIFQIQSVTLLGDKIVSITPPETPSSTLHRIRLPSQRCRCWRL